MIKIYTKTGDSGKTSLFGGVRVLKSDVQVEAYGAIDELTSFVGLIVAHLQPSDTVAQLTLIQKDLYEIMAFLAGAKTPFSTTDRVEALESLIDEVDARLPKLTRFILPQGGVVSSLFHVARTVCRRAEREVVKTLDSSSLDENRLAYSLRYLNRLSDLMFVMSRKYEETTEIVT